MSYFKLKLNSFSVKKLVSKSKYRTILLSAALFLTFDLGVLIPNLIISARIKQDAISINLAGRQRMLSQRMTKALLQIKVAQLKQLDTQAPKQELASSYTLFDETLTGFEKGRIVTGGNSQPVYLKPVETQLAKEIIQQAQTIWQPYKVKIQSVLANNISSVTLRDAVAYAEANNLKLLEVMNSLTTEQQRTADNKANTLQFVQTIGLLLALINFFILLAHSLRKLQDSDARIEKANAEITTLNEQLKQENIRMKTELEVTREVQQMILPKEHELAKIPDLDISGFMQPASEVGGDYYDIIYHDGRVKIGIGDVTGHGLESGMLMLMVQTAVRALLINNETDPTKFLDTLNRTIYQNVQRMKSNKNMTLSLLDYQEGKVRISGQHEEMLVVRREGLVQRVDTIDLGFPIGLEEEISQFIGYTDVNLYPGDMIVLYTDGITEAENQHGQEYGIKRLTQIIKENCQKTAFEVKQAVIDDLKSFTNNHQFSDDVTLVVLKLKQVPATNILAA